MREPPKRRGGKLILTFRAKPLCWRKRKWRYTPTKDLCLKRQYDFSSVSAAPLRFLAFLWLKAVRFHLYMGVNRFDVIVKRLNHQTLSLIDNPQLRNQMIFKFFPRLVSIAVPSVHAQCHRSWSLILRWTSDSFNNFKINKKA